jgi:hypothetical protein
VPLLISCARVVVVDKRRRIGDSLGGRRRTFGRKSAEGGRAYDPAMFHPYFVSVRLTNLCPESASEQRYSNVRLSHPSSLALVAYGANDAPFLVSLGGYASIKGEDVRPMASKSL